MATDTMDAVGWLRKQLEDASPDLLREMVTVFAEALMGAEADEVCNAAYGERSEDRLNRRNGYRSRRWDTRVGTIDLRIPKLRSGSYFPEWLLERQRRAEQALICCVVECYVRGVSTRRVDGLVATLGLESMSKSQVSALATSLDEAVEAFRTRPLDAGPYTFCWVDAMSLKVREGGRIVSVACVIATAVNADGHREILGIDLITSEDGAGWTAFLRGLVARGLKGVALVISDAHEGLKDAIASVLPGAAWQRCRTHFARNVLTKVPKAAADMVASLMRSVYAQPSPSEVWAQHTRVVAQLEDRFGEASTMLVDAAHDVLAFSAFPKACWRQIWSNNPQERLNREIRRRTDVVGIFPNRAAAIRLVGAVLAEQHDEWQVARRYMSKELIAKARMQVVAGGVDELEDEEVMALPEVG